MADLRIGTSGWAYKDWTGPFYPKELKAADRLRFISERFSTCEINASFYRLPSEAAVAAWREQTPDGFVFAWKASRYITHNKKLKDVDDSIPLVFGRMAGLGERFGPVLFQLPPNLHADRERLAAFLQLLPKDRRIAVEFRHPSWYETPILQLLADCGAALCLSDHHHAPAPFETTTDWVYLRGHGPGGRYHGSYGDDQLADWAGRIAGWRAEGKDVYVYFDNDIKSAAPHDAARLVAMTGRAVPRSHSARMAL